jgi:GNAT superfamily N-acetyltransferase
MEARRLDFRLRRVTEDDLRRVSLSFGVAELHVNFDCRQELARAWCRQAGAASPVRRVPGSRPFVRRAVPGDAESVAALARELSIHQGDPSAYFTADAVLRDGFGDAPRFEAWLAEVEGQVAGYALVVPAAYETGYAKAGVYIQDVFVAPGARRRAVGRSLMASVAADARARGLEFVWWASRTWNTESHAFFRTLATVEEPVIAFATFGEKFTSLADEAASDRAVGARRDPARPAPQ